MPTRKLVILTRESEDNQPLRVLLEEEGLAVVECPCLATRKLPFDVALLGEDASGSGFDAVAFSSRRGVEAVAEHVSRLATIPLWVSVGPGTAGAMERMLGRAPDRVAPEGTGESMAGLLLDRLPTGARVLLVRGQQSTGLFQKKLRARPDLSLTELVVYENFRPEIPRLEGAEGGVVLFASPSAVQRFFDVNDHLLSGTVAVAIGPTTQAALEERGHKEIKVAGAMTPEDLLRALVDASKGRPHEQ